jgi:hypothetical protein
MIGEHLRAIAFRIVEIDGFADAVIGNARQSNALHRRMDQPAGDILARRHQESGAVKASRIRRFGNGLRIGLFAVRAS